VCAGVGQTYADNLLNELEAIAASYADVLDRSSIKYVNRNRDGSSVIFVGGADYGWAASDNELESARMALLRRLRDWEPRFRLLFPHPTPEVSNRLDKRIGRLTRWLVRDDDGHDIPPTIEKAQDKISAVFADLRDLCDLLPPDDYKVRLVVDTNALIDNPDTAAYTDVIGGKYVVHLLPVVLREIDNLKRAGRTEGLRAAAQRAERRLKGIRSNGDVLTGVRVAGGVVARFEHIEPRSDHLPDWLDLTVADDRLVASALLLQSEHPGSALYVATSDINMQTKLSAVGLPYVEPPVEASTLTPPPTESQGSTDKS
jgi:rRNA-processing protein FCF1